MVSIIQNRISFGYFVFIISEGDLNEGGHLEKWCLYLFNTSSTNWKKLDVQKWKENINFFASNWQIQNEKWLFLFLLLFQFSFFKKTRAALFFGMPQACSVAGQSENVAFFFRISPKFLAQVTSWTVWHEDFSMGMLRSKITLVALFQKINLSGNHNFFVVLTSGCHR